MKRILSFMLCLAMILTVPVFGAQAAETFTSQTVTTTPLYLISGTNNKAGQEFSPATTELYGVTAYLNNEVANNLITVQVYQGSAKDDTARLLHTETLTLEKTGAAWYKLTLTSPLTVTVGELYSFVLNTQGRCVWNGLVTGSGTYLGLNYDLAAYGGWVRSNVTAFQLMDVKLDEGDPVKNVADLIAALPDPEQVTSAHQSAINAARSAYNTLTAEQKALVENLSKLAECEAALAEALKPQEQKDKETALAKFAEAIVSTDVIPANREDIAALQDRANELIYLYGNATVTGLKEYGSISQMIDQFNQMVDYVLGDINVDTLINAGDALAALKYAVGKEKLDAKAQSAADVDGNGKINAADALCILKFAVGKLTVFDAPTYEPIEKVAQQPYSVKNESLFTATYQSMIDRTQSNGYAQTSINGVYPGMYCRDSSIHVMSHVENGDYEQARKIMAYLLTYHIEYGYDYVIHVMNNQAAPISTQVQTDTTFFFLHAWYLYVTKAPESEAKTAFINQYSSKVKTFANYFLDNNYMGKYDLLYNPSFEHSRDNKYWQTYDLITNVYASQALHELGLYFKDTDATNAAKWTAAADQIAKGIHTNLVGVIDGKTMYSEMIDVEGGGEVVYDGFSWVNLAPMGCDWYAANDKILENTYQLYMQYGSCLYYRKYQMLDVYSTYNGSPLRQGNHVIGKGLAWEMMYCKKMGYTDRLIQLVSFIEEYSDEMYRETWSYYGGGGDTANQEHANWMLYAQRICFPELKTNQ